MRKYFGHNFAAVLLLLFLPGSILPQKIKIVFPQDKSVINSYDSQIKFFGPVMPLLTFKIKAEISTDAGRTWSDVYFSSWGRSDSQYTVYKWTPPAINSDSCKLRITDTANTSNYDITKGYFSLYKVHFDSCDINNIKVWLGTNGSGSLKTANGYDQAGFFWPQGSGDMWKLNYADGLLWSGKAGGVYREGGNHLRNGLQPGNILNSGMPAHPVNDRFKIWKLKRNWESLPAGKERSEYEYNYSNWPADLGAPWTDVNNDKQYTKGIDRPEILGDETLFYVANDMDSARVSLNYNKSLPIGLELQVTNFAFSSVEALKDVIFKRYRIINKSAYNITDMYFAYFGDPDIGDAMDDYTGCDSALALGYAYNSRPQDNYSTGIPPAIGYMLLQGPAVPSANGKAVVNFSEKQGYINMPMTSFTPMIKYLEWWVIPMYPSSGRNDIYTLVRGQRYDKINMTDPYTEKISLFPLSGDPDKETGWYEGKGWPAGPLAYHRWLSVNTGPFTFASKDTQEVVVAMVAARGTSSVNSVTVLRNKAAAARNFYYNILITPVKEEDNKIPGEFILNQNYPNPFNPATTISYTIPKESYVELKVFDILGREVTTLVKGQQSPGNYKVQFDGTSLPSGLYIYTLQAGSFMASKKLMLLK